MYYDIFIKLENEELVKKIKELTDMWRFYNSTGNASLSLQIKDALDIAYEIMDEREFMRIHKEYDPPDGVIIDGSKKRETKDITPPKVVGRKPTI